ncbi:MAG: extracellular solute-binding protein [Gammaproteobacteria bacterium]|nr:extracellular solute-binding protein [Gammaproteobacteria bacterium]NIR85004.1 extracellular solute-binding protein [Gammaproteobacteria bacterium]NIR88271.1 extracellular solute-binding protein [Gammaproteobacteria bacterium]NIU06051.1 extracellular solute-binding protein [Gammaproteobacteria bacterium]NIV73470.1 extracellular solute-binding protein [Gammaproteobacteria bacterium]
MSHAARPRGISRRRFLGATASVAAAASVGLPSRGRAAERELNALMWCDHTDLELLRPFEEAFNCRINVKEYQETGAALAVLEQSQPGDWDVFVVDSVDVRRVVERGLLAPLPDDEMPWDAIFPELRQPKLHYVDGQLYAVPEKFGYNAIAFNNVRVPAEDVRRADVMWSPKYEGRIAVYDYYIPAMEMVALGMGIKPHDIDRGALPAIRDKLLEIKPLASVIGDVPTVQNALVTGAADIVIAGGEFAVAGLSRENPAMDWTLPAEGGIRWMQAIGVFAASRRQELATEFVKYIVGPQAQATLAQASCYWAMPANSRAQLGAEVKRILRWDQQRRFIDNSYPYFIPDPGLNKAMLDVWTEFLQA